MPKMIFVSLPVKNLGDAAALYKAVGFTPNPQFSDETTASMIWSETIHVMLQTHAKWRSFTKRPIAPEGSSEVMISLSCESRKAVDAMNAAAVKHGGIADINPAQDLGFLYNRNFADLDGHVWEAVWMDPAAAPAG